MYYNKLCTTISSDSFNTVQNRCLIKKQEVKEEHAVPVDKVLKVEIYELLHAADCAKVSYLHFCAFSLFICFSIIYFYLK